MFTREAERERGQPKDPGACIEQKDHPELDMRAKEMK